MNQWISMNPLSRKKQNSIQWVTLIWLLCLGMISKNAYADPLTAILGLLFADKVSGQPANSRASDKNTTSDNKDHITDWRKTLSEPELAALDNIQNHPAVGTCMELANQNNPIASYNARKIAEFSAYIKLSYAKTGETPDIESIRYQWPARAFRWCSNKAGITTAGTPRNLEQLAHGMIRVVQNIEVHHTVVAQNVAQNIAEPTVN